jgi:hypothetical protein
MDRATPDVNALRLAMATKTKRPVAPAKIDDHLRIFHPR